jgi:hypothetical protein
MDISADERSGVVTVQAQGDGNPNSPQTRHSAEKRNAENGGILLVSAESGFVAKTAQKGHLFP